MGAAGLAPPIVSGLAARAMSAPRVFNLVVSNVPGPQQTFYLDGVPLREVYPAVPLNPRNQALSIGILSYDGGVYFGLLADRGALPDVADAAAQGSRRPSRGSRRRLVRLTAPAAQRRGEAEQRTRSTAAIVAPSRIVSAREGAFSITS